MTKARPPSFLIAGRRLSRAVSPPAEAPMPTTGTAELRMGFPSLPWAWAFGLGIPACCFLFFGRAACHAGEAAAHQFAHRQRVVLVVARPAVEMVGEMVPILGTLAVRHPAGQRRSLLVRALQCSQHPVDLLFLGREDGIGAEGMPYGTGNGACSMVPSSISHKALWRSGPVKREIGCKFVAGRDRIGAA